MARRLVLLLAQTTAEHITAARKLAATPQNTARPAIAPVAGHAAADIAVSNTAELVLAVPAPAAAPSAATAPVLHAAQDINAIQTTTAVLRTAPAAARHVPPIAHQQPEAQAAGVMPTTMAMEQPAALPVPMVVPVRQEALVLPAVIKQDIHRVQMLQEAMIIAASAVVIAIIRARRANIHMAPIDKKILNLARALAEVLEGSVSSQADSDNCGKYTLNSCGKGLKKMFKNHSLLLSQQVVLKRKTAGQKHPSSQMERNAPCRHWKHLKLDRDSRRLEQLLAAGFNKSEIARRLGVHRNTVGAYLKRK